MLFYFEVLISQILSASLARYLFPSVGKQTITRFLVEQYLLDSAVIISSSMSMSMSDMCEHGHVDSDGHRRSSKRYILSDEYGHGGGGSCKISVSG